jgi:hypothetical protein
MFVPGKLSEPGLMFADKAGAYLSEASFRSSTLGFYNIGPKFKCFKIYFTLSLTKRPVKLKQSPLAIILTLA